jgi:putative pyruvate formate lyase activating enzyme
LAGKYSHAKDYPECVKAAIAEMYRQVGTPEFDDNGFITKGVIVRNLLLPGHVNDSKQIIDYLYRKYGDEIFISIMSQYTPMAQIKDKYPELNRRVTKREYDAVVQFALDLGIENAFIQDRKVAKESFIPDFNGEGI